MRGKGFKCSGVDAGNSNDDEPDQHENHTGNQGNLESSRRLDTEEVDSDQEKRERSCDGALWMVDEVSQVGGQADESEGCLEDQGEPHTESSDRPHERAHRTIDVEI